MSKRRKPQKVKGYERKRKYKKRIARLADITDSYDRIDNDRNVTTDPEQTRYVKRCYKANHAPGRIGFLKKISNRKTRRYRGEIADGCRYKRIYDLDWVYD